MDPETLTDEEKSSDEALAAKTKVLLERNSKIVAEREKYRKVLSSDYHSLFPFFSLSPNIIIFHLLIFYRKHGIVLGCST